MKIHMESIPCREQMTPRRLVIELDKKTIITCMEAAAAVTATVLVTSAVIHHIRKKRKEKVQVIEVNASDIGTETKE